MRSCQKFLTVIEQLSVSLYGGVHFCFMYFDAILLGAYKLGSFSFPGELIV